MNFLVRLQLVFAAAQLFLTTHLVLACSASKHPHFLKRTPRLFAYSSDVTKSEKLCAKQGKGKTEQNAISK